MLSGGDSVGDIGEKHYCVVAPAKPCTAKGGINLVPCQNASATRGTWHPLSQNTSKYGPQHEGQNEKPLQDHALGAIDVHV